MNLSDTDRKAFEGYLMAKTEEEQQDSIRKLIPGSELYYYLYFLDRLKKVGPNLTQEDEQNLQNFKNKYSYSQLLSKIQARIDLLKYDAAETQQEKEQLLSKIQGYLPHINFEYYKPEDISRQDDHSSQSEDESAFTNSVDLLNLGTVPATHSQKKLHYLDYDRYFSKDKIAAKFEASLDQNQALQNLNAMPQGFEHQIDFSLYNMDAVYNWACTCDQQRISDLQNKSFYDSLQSYFVLQFSVDRYFTLNQQICDKVTLLQLERIATLHPKIKEDKNFIGSFFQKYFHEELSKENQELFTAEEKRDNLLTLYAYTKAKEMPNSLQSSLLIEILQLGVKLDTYDEELFREYLKKPHQVTHQVLKANKVSVADNHWNRYIGNVQTQSNQQGRWNESQDQIIKQYLEYFCQKNGGSLESFREDFDTDYLKQIEERIAIFNSDDLTNLNVDIKKYQSISQEVIIRFLDSNQETFKVEEEVKLALELKNVQTLYVKIFEFNTETYYKKTLQPFNTGVNLDGLIASIEKIHEYKNPPNKKFIESFTFPELTGRVGLFIVEFIGNGLSSRAVIKKGSLSMIHKPTIAGHLAYVLDENKKICSGLKTGIFFDGQYFEASAEKGGKIFIPYGKSQSVSKAILMNNGFAQLSDFQRLTEEYSFNAWIYLNNESILIGNKASVIIQPMLSVNNRPALAEILKNTKITLTTLNYVDNIPVTKTYENIKFSNNKELILDFQVPPYLSNISVSIETEVFNITQQSNQKFTASRAFQVATNQHSKNMNVMFLRKEQGDYFIYLLGKNGEPKKNVNLNLKIMHSKLMTRDFDGRDVTLNTDRDGKVKLGHLKSILGLQVTCPLFNISATWMINQTKVSLTYPSTVEAIENETIEFPVVMNQKNRKNISLIRINKENIVLEDLFDQIEFVKEDNQDYSRVVLKNLPDGQYLLNLKKLRKIISITINKGQYWESDNFILKRNCLFENRAPLKMVKISNVKIEESKEESKSNVKIQLKDFTKETRVHIYANQFENFIPQQMFAEILRNNRNQAQKTVFPFAMWKNIFMSNRELSDEFRYVFDRKYAERFQGNTLERPRLVLKRTFIQTTQINQEMLKSGTQFAQQPVHQEIQHQLQNIAPRSYDRMHEFSNFAHAAYDEVDYRSSSSSREPGNFGYDGLLDLIGSGLSGEQKITEFQNFLKSSPLSLFNLYPNEDGEVAFTANLAPFSQLSIVVINHQSVAQRQVDLETTPIQKRDLSLVQPLNSEKGFTESRTTVNIAKHDTHFIEDITSTEIQLIDDMNKVKGVLEELMKTQGSNSGVYSALSGLFLQWPKLKKDEKNKQYSKHFCHELNIYLYFKDKEYFDEIAKTYIQNKLEKTFIDYYLLGNYDKILHYSSISGLKKINALEKCFLVDALLKKGLREDARKVVNHLELSRSTQDWNSNVAHYNKVFDTVLNLNMLQLNVEDPLSNFGDFSANAATTTASINPGFGFGMAQPPVFNDFANFNQMQMQPQFGGSAFLSANHYQQHAQVQQQPVQRMAMMRRAAPQMESLNRVQPMSYNNFDLDAFMPQQQMALDDFSDNYSRNVVAQYDDQKKKHRLQFEEVQTTNEYMETHYYKQKNFSESANKIPINSFWADYSTYLLNQSDSSQPFLSSNFIRNADNSVASLLTFALIDLPFEAESHGYKTNEGRGVEIKACNNIILFKKEVREAPQELSNDILITHRYIESDNHQASSSAMPEEFLTNKAYTCEVIMTNVSPMDKNFSILYQIPQGSLPLEMTKYMKSLPQHLSSYTTIKLAFHFYFPQSGKYLHFPSNASQEQVIVSKATENTLNVVDRRSVNKKETFRDIIQSGNQEDIIEFLKKHNLEVGEKGFNYNDLLWMLKDKSFFFKVIEVLRERAIYNDQIWSFGFYHKDEETIKEYLQLTYTNQLRDTYLGYTFQSKLISVSEQQKEIKHLDYYPFINARAHSVGDLEQWTLNKNFKSSYETMLQYFVELKELRARHLIQLVYSLQLQDRINEAITIFYSIDLAKEADEHEDAGFLQIQYDYMQAYFDFFTGHADGFKTARGIVRKYEDYPLPQWRLLFLEILDQLNEFDGEDEEVAELDEENLSDEQKKLKLKQQIKKEPKLECEVNSEKNSLTIEVANIKAISIKFYIIDAEILFSRTPFLKENTEEFSYVKPTHIIERELGNADLNSSIDTVTYLQTAQKFDLEVPQELKNQNMVIEVTGEGKQLFKTYYSTQIKVNILEAYGELKVTDTQGQALPKVYVKVFAQKKGGSTSNPFFFKDGYTDIRGKFEYAQTSGNRLKEVQKFAIFIMSDTLGSIIKECNPPKADETSVAAVEEGTHDQQKQTRIISKVNNYKAKMAK